RRASSRSDHPRHDRVPHTAPDRENFMRKHEIRGEHDDAALGWREQFAAAEKRPFAALEIVIERKRKSELAGHSLERIGVHGIETAGFIAQEFEARAFNDPAEWKSLLVAPDHVAAGPVQGRVDPLAHL